MWVPGKNVADAHGPLNKFNVLTSGSQTFTSRGPLTFNCRILYRDTWFMQYHGKVT